MPMKFIVVIFFLFPLLLLHGPLSALEKQTPDVLKKDITDRFKSIQESQPRKINVLTILSSDRNTTLVAISEKPFSVFFGEKLILSDATRLTWNIDSLNAALSFPNELTFFSGHSSPIRLTQIIQAPPDPLKSEPRIKNEWMDFAIIACSILILFFILISTVMLKGMFGFLKLFSVNLRDDRTEELRINSVPALLFYVFVLLSISVVVTLYLGREYSSSVDYFSGWIKLCGTLLFIMVLRYMTVLVMSWIYSMQEVMEHQMNGFFRLAFLLCLLAGTAMIIDFIFMVRWILSVPVITILIPLLIALYYLTFYIRLRRSISLRPLHLFSYLCISEFIPLVLLVFTF